MISEMIVRKRIYEGIFGNYQMKYFREFNLHADIVLIVYMFCVKIILFFSKVDVRKL